MSINHIEDYPTGDDAVDFSDPVAEEGVTEPNPGTDTLHVDPDAGSITHMDHAKGRDWRLMDVFESDESIDPDAAFGNKNLYSGTDDAQERWVHDDALQVRQLVPTSFGTGQWSLTSSVAVNVAPARRERMTIILSNIGSFPVYVSNQQSMATPTSGFPIPAGGVLHLDALTAVWASVNTTLGNSTLAVLDQFRTDNRGN